MVDYSERLKSAMADAKPKPVSTAELARLMGVTFQAVRKVENGGKFGTKNNVKAAKLLRVSSDWLATGVGERHARGDDATAAGEDLVILAEDRQFLQDFHALLDDDEKARIREEMSAKAAKARATRERIERDALSRHGIVRLDENEKATPADEAMTARLTTDAPGIAGGRQKPSGSG